MVPVRKCKGQDFRDFLVDTGAAYTALSKDVVALLGMTSAPQRTAAIILVHGGIISEETGIVVKGPGMVTALPTKTPLITGEELLAMGDIGHASSWMGALCP